MIAAFRAHGPIAGWKFLRRSNCAFIDFETGAGAAAARDALHGATFSGWGFAWKFTAGGCHAAHGCRMQGCRRAWCCLRMGSSCLV